jgi:glycosyltransferase involved in cell wall biosynthesis
MRVGFITYGLDRPLTGISRYTLELARAYETMPDFEVVLLKAGSLGPLADSPFEQVDLPGCARLPGLLTLGHAVLPAFARRYHLDILHDPSAVTPLLFGAGGARVVSTVHDVIPVSYPGYSSRIDELIYCRWLPHRLPRNWRVITDSEHSKNDIVRYMGVSSDKIDVIMLGVRDLFRPVAPDAAKAALHRFDINFPYIMFLGNLTRRKNIELALRGFAQVADQFPDLRFVVAGPTLFRETPIGALAEDLGITERLVLPGAVSDADLPALYSGARVFLFPSFYEGFGLPVLEAMACGTPVITSTASSLPQVAGDAALLVDPNSLDEMTSALTRLLMDEALRDSLRTRGLAHAGRFTWAETARQTADVYRAMTME